MKLLRESMFPMLLYMGLETSLGATELVGELGSGGRGGSGRGASGGCGGSGRGVSVISP